MTLTHATPDPTPIKAYAGPDAHMRFVAALLDSDGEDVVVGAAAPVTPGTEPVVYAQVGEAFFAFSIADAKHMIEGGKASGEACTRAGLATSPMIEEIVAALEIVVGILESGVDPARVNVTNGEGVA